MFNKKENKIENNDAFITLIQVAKEDEQMREQLLKIVTAPPENRKNFLAVYIPQLQEQKAPEDFIEALAFLYDDEIAKKVHKLIV